MTRGSGFAPGASLVQLYSAMVYEGPGIARRIALGLAAAAEARRLLAAFPRRSAAKPPSAAASGPRLRGADRRRRRSSPSRISTPVSARILALAGLEVDAALRAGPRASRARIWSLRPGSSARARRGSARPARSCIGSVPVDRGDQRLGDIRRGSHCRRPSRSRRRSGRRGSAGSSAPSTSAGACPARRRWRPGGPGRRSARNEKSVSWLLRKKPSTIRPVPKMLSTVVVIETTLPSASRTMKCEVPVGSSVRSAPRDQRAGRDAGAPAAGRPSCRSASRAGRRKPGRSGPRPAPSRTPDRRHICRGRRTSAGSPRRTGTRPAGRSAARSAMSVRSRIIISSTRPTPLDGGGGAQSR